MAYFLKSVGVSDDPLPQRWWEKRPEIVDGMFFHKRPAAVDEGATLIYYAVGGDGRLCGVATVTGPGSDDFEVPPHWNDHMRAKFRWRMPVRLLHRCAADERAPRLADFQAQRIGQGSYQRVDDETGERMVVAIAAVARPS